MKIYISADIEGITGVTDWDETKQNHPDWQAFAKQMTEEVLAAVNGAVKAGAKEIIVKDAHDSGRNIDIKALPEEVKLIRGWTGDPLSMVAGIDESFDALIFIGYHNAGGTITNPLVHTMNVSSVLTIKINDEYASEFLLNAYAGALYKVPVVFVSGDSGLTKEVNKFNSNIVTLGVKDGIGGATINMNPKKAVIETEKLVKEALNKDLDSMKVKSPEEFKVQIEYKDHKVAYKNSFYPGAEFIAPRTVEFKTKEYYEVLRMIHFLT
ncbi:M55 family metallopeptidase [Clostridium chromiireducens]|uniref:Amino acid amidase n=1 Tax=Clostridium chromiireducens TaxID=225345 RepID=A0A1V4IHK0_9CLOT|nr:M55 family metallopeptidase [Clostridium chromiireducens]OPJ59406.1 D-aminopeptidase [Clostridium chromiireducens]RII34285.1 amino acid amidase [Clostridium chromiireducens]